MRYKYTAFTEKGVPVSDTIVAKNKKSAEMRLNGRGLKVEKLKANILGGILDGLKSSVSGVSYKDKVIFTRNMAVMVKAGLTLDESLGILAEQSTSPRLSHVILEMSQSIQSGKTFSESLAKFPRIFETIYINIVMAAETSGTLEQSLRQLADQMNQQYEIRAKIRNALFYPATVVVATIGIALLLSIFVLPKITKLFASFKTTLPFSTRVIIAFSDFMTEYTLFVLLGLAILVFFVPVFIRLKPIRPLWHHLLLRLPVVGRFTLDFNLALFCRTLGTLLTAGVPINKALETVSDTMRNVRYHRALRDIVTMQQSGEGLGALLRQYPHLFTPMVHRMISVGEESGNIEDVLVFLADFHEKEIDYLAKNLTNILEPLLLIMIGLAVAVVAMAVITPIYQITGSFQFK